MKLCYRPRVQEKSIRVEDSRLNLFLFSSYFYFIFYLFYFLFILLFLDLELEVSIMLQTVTQHDTVSYIHHMITHHIEEYRRF